MPEVIYATNSVRYIAEKGLGAAEAILVFARDYGACFDMRDEPLDVPIPESYEPLEEIAAVEEAKLALLKWQSMSRAGQLAMLELEQKKEAEEQRESERKIIEANAFLGNLLNKISAWNPGPDHESLQSRALAQLTDALWDGLKSEREFLPITEYDIADRFETLRANVAYRTQELAKAHIRANERTRWIRELRESLKGLDS